MKHVFPKYLYHKDCIDGRIVRSQEEFDKLGAGWCESPGLCEKVQESSESKAPPAIEELKPQPVGDESKSKKGKEK